MTAKVEIQLKADVDRAIAQLKKVDGELKDISTSAKKQGGVLGELKGSWIAALGVVGAATGAFYTLNKTVGDSIRGYTEYSETIRDMVRWTGTSAEETSALVQAADDAFISQEKLTNAMKIGVRQGFLPSIENVAKLADQYVALSDPMAKNKLLIEKFGRSGLEMGKLLERGSEGIRKSADEAKRLGLVLSGDNLDDVKRYKEAMDQLGDAIEGAKIRMAQGMTPAIEEVVNEMNEWFAAIEKDNLAIKTMGEIQQEYVEGLLGVPPAYDAAAEAARRYAIATGAAAGGQAEVLEGLPNLESGFKDWTNAAIAAQTVSLLWNEATSDGALSGAELDRIMRVVKATNQDELIPSIQEAARNFSDSKDGVLDLTEALNAIPKRIDTHVYVHYHGGGGGGGGSTAGVAREAKTYGGGPGMQHGGRLTGGMTLVGEAGPELIIDGMVIPADETRRLLAFGLIPAVHAQRGTRAGRPGINIGQRAVIPIVGAGGRVGPGAAVGGISYGGAGGGIAASEQTATQTATQAATQAAVETAQTTATIAAAAIGAQMPLTINATVDRQARALAEIQGRQTAETIAALGRIERLLREQPSSISRSVRDAIQQVL